MDDVIQQAVDESRAANPPEPSLTDIAYGDKMGVPPEQARQAVLRKAIDQAKQRYEGRSTAGAAAEFVGNNMAPIVSPFVNAKWSQMVNESNQRIESGTYTDEDLGRVAYQHVRDEAAARQGFGRQLVGAAGKAVGLLGESYLTGGAGGLIPSGGAAVVPSAIAGTARLATQTALMPSLYAEAAQQRANANGGSGLDANNLLPAFVEGMITNKILGSMGKAGEALAGRAPTLAGRIAARAATGAALMPAEQQMADVATSATDNLLPDAYQFKTHYGLMGDLLHGKNGEAAQSFALQAITGAVFAAVHTPGHEAERKAAFQDALERYNAKLLSMSRRGDSSQRVFDSATKAIGAERQAQVAQITSQAEPQAQKPPEATQPEAQQAAPEARQAPIAPSPGESAPPQAPETPGAIPGNEKPAPVGAAPSAADQSAELERSIGLRPGEWATWKQKNPGAAAALESALGGGRPVIEPQKAATYADPFAAESLKSLIREPVSPEGVNLGKADANGRHPVLDAAGKELGAVTVVRDGDNLRIQAATGDMGVGVWKAVAREMKAVHPDAKTLTFIRTTGPNKGKEKTVSLRRGGAILDEAPGSETVPGNARIAGQPTTIEAFGFDRPIPAKYAVFDLADLKASHTYKAGAPTPTEGYPAGLQPRNYAPRSEEDLKVRRFAAERKAGYFLSTHPAADSGPPTVSADGTVLNGNGRSMALQYTDSQGKSYGWYKDALTKVADQFGIDPAKVESLKRPVLVRVVDMDPSSPEAARFARAGNIVGVQAQSPTRSAKALSGLVTSDVLKSLHLSEDTTFSEAVTDPRQGRAFREALYSALPPSERDRYFNNDQTLTESGKEFTRLMLLSKILPVETIERLGEERKQVKRSVEGAIPQLLQLREGGQFDVDVSGPLSEALDVLARNPRMKTPADAENVMSQASLFGGMAEPMKPAARMMLDFVLEYGDRPTVFRKRLTDLVKGQAEKTGLFGDFVNESASDIAARALGVPLREGANFGPEPEAKELRDALEQTERDGHAPSDVAEAVHSGLQAGESSAATEERSEAAAGDADQGNAGAGPAAADVAERTDDVVGAAPSGAKATISKLEGLDAAKLPATEAKLLPLMIDALAGGNDLSLVEMGRRVGLTDEGVRLAEGRLLKLAGSDMRTVQDVRDFERERRADVHRAPGGGLPEGFHAGPPPREHPEDAARDRVTDKLLAGEKLSPEDLKAFGAPLSSDERRQAGIGGVHGQFGTTGAAQGPMRETALANAIVDQQRAKRGQPPMMSEARKAFGVSWDQAMARLEADPRAALRLIDELTVKTRPIDDVESSLLMHRQVMLQNEHERALDQHNLDLQRNFTEGADAATIERRRRQAELRVREVRQQMDQLDAVTREVGTQNGRALAIRAQLVKEDFSLGSLIRQAEAARGRELTAAEENQVRDMARQIKDLQDRLSAAEAKVREPRDVQAPPIGTREAGLWRRAAEWFRGLFGESNKAPEAPQKGALWQAADRWEKEATAELSAKLGGKLFAGFDPSLIAPLSKYVAAKIVKGGYSFAEFSKAIIGRFGKDVEPHVADIWRRAETMARGAAEPPSLPYNSPERVALERKKQEFRGSLVLAEAKGRPWLERAADYFASFERGMVLSGPRTLLKLTSAAIQRMVATPLEEIAGHLAGKLVPGVAGRAPREGGFSWAAEAKALTGFFASGMRDAWDTLRTGKSSLDVLYTKGQDDLPPSWGRFMDFFGRLHGALKAPVKRAEFERSLQKRMEFGLKDGLNIYHPGIQMALGVAAFKDAERAIFQQSNAVVDGYNSLLKRLEKPDVETGRVPVAGKAGATALRVVLPVVRVPTNVVAETLTHMFGSVSGSVHAARAYARGIESLKPGEADVIMRQLKKGSLGAAGLALGALGASQIGGYYQPGQKRDERDVGAGEARVFGVDVPKAALHNPLLETLQVGATAARAAESGKKGQEPAGTAAGITRAILGLMEEVPFVGAAGEAERAVREPGRAANRMAKRLIVPLGVSSLAEQMDRDSAGNRIVRQPHGPVETVQSGVPGLRNRLDGRRRGGRVR